MKSWVDTTYSNKDMWLVLVFHGIDSLGWEPTPIPKLEEYFKYIKDRDDKLWIATFGDVARYIREREHATINSSEKDGKIIVSLTHSLSKTDYDLPLTLKTYIPSTWSRVTVTQGTNQKTVDAQHDEKGSYILYQAEPNTTYTLLTGS